MYNISVQGDTNYKIEVAPTKACEKYGKKCLLVFPHTVKHNMNLTTRLSVISSYRNMQSSFKCKLLLCSTRMYT